MSGSDNLPKTPLEAVAQGYRPIDDVDKYIRDKLGISQSELDSRRDEFSFVFPGVDCANLSNVGKICRQDPVMGFVCFCGPNRNCNCFGK
jgi:hypothetical protein